MAYVFIDPDAVGDADTVFVDGECYSYTGESDDTPPDYSSVDGTCDSCGNCPCVDATCCDDGLKTPQYWRIGIGSCKQDIGCPGACLGAGTYNAKLYSLQLNDPKGFWLKYDPTYVGGCAWTATTSCDIRFYSDLECTTQVASMSTITLWLTTGGPLATAAFICSGSVTTDFGTFEVSAAWAWYEFGTLNCAAGNSAEVVLTDCVGRPESEYVFTFLWYGPFNANLVPGGHPPP